MQGMLLAAHSLCAQGRGDQDPELGATELPALPSATSLALRLGNLLCGKAHLAGQG